MPDRTVEITRKLSSQIRKITLQGQSDSMIHEGNSDKYMYYGGLDVHWQAAGRFLILYIESYGNDNACYYRIYRFAEEASYDRRIVSNHSLESEDCRCVFDYKEDGDDKCLAYLHEDGIWYEDYKEALNKVVGKN